VNRRQTRTNRVDVLASALHLLGPPSFYAVVSI
jgi:hypothetical protein